MKDLWKEPRDVRNGIQNKAKQLRKSIAERQKTIAHLEPWLNGVRQELAEDEKNLAQLLKDYGAIN